MLETGQVFDIAPLPVEVTEHRVLEAVWACGRVHRGEFPVLVSAPVQYALRLKTAVMHLTHRHRVPVSRTGDLIDDLFTTPAGCTGGHAWWCRFCPNPDAPEIRNLLVIL